MPTQAQTIQQPSETWQGTDLTRSDFLRDPDTLVYSENLLVTDSGGSLVTRPGFRHICKHLDSTGLIATSGLGTFDYSYTDSDGNLTREVLVAGKKLYRMKEQSFTYSYSGAASTVRYTIQKKSGTNDFQFIFTEDGVVTQDINLGTGRGGGDLSVAGLKAAIDALATFSCSTAAAPGDETPAAYIKPISSATSPITFNYLEAIPLGDDLAYATKNPFEFNTPDDSWSNLDSPASDGLSSCILQDCMYFQGGYDPEYKYDGDRCYRSGVPHAGVIYSGYALTAPVTADSITATSIDYLVRLKCIDARGNTTYGIAQALGLAISPAAQNVLITLLGATGVPSTRGFKTGCGMVNGTQLGVTTITIDAGHPFKVGDVVYLNTVSTGAYVGEERNVTATSATSITISGAAINILDNEAISLNMRVELYRQTSATSDYFLVNEFAFNNRAITYTIRDTGTALGATYIAPLPGTEPGLPPIGKYVTAYRGMKFIGEGKKAFAGLVDTTTDLPRGRVLYSDIENPEGYSISYNNFNLDACSFSLQNGDPSGVTGVYGSEEYLAIFKSDSLAILTGAVSQEGYFKYKVDPYSNVVGCISHHTVQQIPTGEVMFLHRTGVFAIDGGGGIVEVTLPISPIMPELVSSRSAAIGTPTDRFRSYMDSDRGIYVVAATHAYVGVAPPGFGGLALCVDFKKLDKQNKPTLYIWRNLDLGGGAFVQRGTGTLYFTPWTNDGSGGIPGSNARYPLSRIHDSSAPLNLADHDLPIRARGIFGWIDGGEPSYFKTPMKTKLFAVDPDTQSFGALELEIEIDFRRVSASSFELDLTGQTTPPQSYVYRYNTATITNAEVEQALNRFKCKAMRYKFSKDTIYENVLITMLETELAVPYEPKMKE